MPIKCKISEIFHHDNKHDGGDQKKVHLERNNSALLRGEEYKCIWPHIRAHDEIPWLNNTCSRLFVVRRGLGNWGRTFHVFAVIAAGSYLERQSESRLKLLVDVVTKLV
jgi:hypothetical protein